MKTVIEQNTCQNTINHKENLVHLYRMLIIGIAVISLSKTFADNIPKDSSGMVNIIDPSANEKINTDLQDPERMYLIATEFSLPIRGVYTLTMERTIKHSKTWGITGVIETDT